jgi:iron complex transport system substrate-binding protein
MNPGFTARPTTTHRGGSFVATTRFSRRSLLLGLAALGCRRNQAALPAGAAHRVVSITPNTTETLFALGVGDRVVGRSRYCDFPPDVTALPSVGGYVDPSLEAILALRPDLVTGARGPIGRSLVERLEARGIRTHFPSAESRAEIEAMIRGLGALVDATPQADALVASMQSRLETMRQRLAGVSPPRVLLVFGRAPVVVAGPGSFPAEMLQMAGCRNAVVEGTRYPTLGMETIVGLDADWILDAFMDGPVGRGSIHAGTAGWGMVRAVRDGRVIVLGSEAVLRPGPRFPEGVATIARAVHPGVALP